MNRFKEDLTKKINELFPESDNARELIDYINAYNKQKKEISVISEPVTNRCCAILQTKKQCSRPKKTGYNCCGSHVKNAPYGYIDSGGEKIRINVFTVDIQGIMYYIDDNNNIYDPEHVLENMVNPAIIGKVTSDEEGVYRICELN